MVSKVIDATEMRAGTFIMIDGSAHQVKKMDVSKTGKHGHAKVRFEAISVMTGKKKVGVVPGHDKLDSPIIEKKTAQVLSLHEDSANVMDNESYETFDLKIPEELKGAVEEGKEISYWVIMNKTRFCLIFSDIFANIIQ